MKKVAISAFLISILVGTGVEVKAQSQRRLISGNVRSSGDANPLPGVAVEALLSKISSGTQEDGNFYIELKDQDSVLVFRLPGFKTKEVKLGKPYEYQVFLEPETGLTRVKFGMLTLETPFSSSDKPTGSRGRVGR